jgi:ATP/maltotriose-dependent transcriptional regulator MalT
MRMPERTDALTGRELEVLRLLAQGLSNKEIARGLHLAEETVKFHVRHILAKFSVQSRTQAVLTAMRLGLISSQSPAHKETTDHA